MTKTKVGILYGGRSVEHGVSVNSARNIEEYIDKDQFEIYRVGISTSGVWYITEAVSRDIEKGKKLTLDLDATKPFFSDEEGNAYRMDIAFPVLHGTDGEDGSIQGLLKAMDIPMVGTGVLGSATSMSKLVTKQLLLQANLPVVPFLSYRFDQRSEIKFSKIKSDLGVPFVVKAANLGSSVGVSIVKDEAGLKNALDDSFKYDDSILIEKFIKGREIECAILGNYPPEASLPGEIIIGKDYEFYSFDAKYVDKAAVTIDVPAKLDSKIAEKIRTLSVRTFQAMHGEDFARIDLFVSNENEIFINEVNTIPGFTNSSMYPMMWKDRGVSFTELITRLIRHGMERFQKAKRIEKNFQSALKF